MEWSKQEWRSWLNKRGFNFKDEIEKFIENNKTVFGDGTKQWFRGYESLSEIWERCENSTIMLKMLRCGEYHNYDTGLLVYSGNVINFITNQAKNRKMKAICAEVSLLMASAISRIPLMKIVAASKEIAGKIHTLQGSYNDSIWSIYIDKIVSYIGRNPRGKSLEVATTTTEWYSKVARNTSSRLHLADELRKLVGNPFTHIDTLDDLV